MIRVLIADVMPDARDHVAVLLKGEPGIEVVGVASDGQTAVSLAREIRPDIVLLDSLLAGANFRTAEQLGEHAPAAGVIVAIPVELRFPNLGIFSLRPVLWTGGAASMPGEPLDHRGSL